MADDPQPAAAGSEFTLTRHSGAPRARVWKAWTEPEHLLKWFSPVGMTMASCTMDLRIGGSFLHELRFPDGSDMWGKWVFSTITPPARLAWTHGFADAAGQRTRHPMAPNWPLEMLCTVSLDERNGATELTLRMTAHHATPAEQLTFDSQHASLAMGWGGTLTQLDGYLATMR